MAEERNNNSTILPDEDKRKDRNTTEGNSGLCGVILTLALFFPLKSLASATSFIMLLIFLASNAALIVLERRKDEAPFDIPTFVPWVGIVLTVGILVGQLLLGGGGGH
ncbi:MAG: hypothetical protein OHK0029_35370 [Armatimonadaceae bacterium]